MINLVTMTDSELENELSYVSAQLLSMEIEGIDMTDTDLYTNTLEYYNKLRAHYILD